MGGVLGHVLRDGAPGEGQVPLPARGAGAGLVLRAVAHRAHPRVPSLGPLQVGLDVWRGGSLYPTSLWRVMWVKCNVRGCEG